MTNAILNNTIASDSRLNSIKDKVLQGSRLTPEDGIYLFDHASLGWVGALANHVREKMHGDNTYFNRNFHIEPTNVCVFSCKFCSYSRLYKNREAGWELSMDQMLDIVKNSGYDGFIGVEYEGEGNEIEGIKATRDLLLQAAN